MSNPITHAFFVGRATAEALVEQLQDSVTDFLSVVGKFDAEQREKLRTFTETVLEKASREEDTVATNSGEATLDLQEIVDNLRAEVAQLKSELQQYRDRHQP